ncbi:hypothetical protein PC114_g6856 [Phytophthora cactorum]|nr:hypothetical protein PC114_g6856 [Phytophthora cactorum]
MDAGVGCIKLGELLDFGRGTGIFGDSSESREQEKEENAELHGRCGEKTTKLDSAWGCLSGTGCQLGSKLENEEADCEK